MTTGEMLFYGGIIGGIVVILISIIIIVVLSKGKSALRHKFDIEIKK